MCLYIADQSCSKHSWSNKLPGSSSWPHTWPPNWRGPIVGGCQEHGAFQLEYSSLGMCLGFDVLYRIRMNSIQWMNYCMCYIGIQYSGSFVSRIFSVLKKKHVSKAGSGSDLIDCEWLAKVWHSKRSPDLQGPCFNPIPKFEFQTIQSCYACFNCHDRFVSDFSLYDRHIDLAGFRL